MFGTIGHARLKDDASSQLTELMDEWKRTIRPTIPGSILELPGTSRSREGEGVFIALMQDEDTYCKLANDPKQDAWYRRFMEIIDGDVAWEDVEMDITVQD